MAFFSIIFSKTLVTYCTSSLNGKGSPTHVSCKMILVVGLDSPILQSNSLSSDYRRVCVRRLHPQNGAPNLQKTNVLLRLLAATLTTISLKRCLTKIAIVILLLPTIGESNNWNFRFSESFLIARPIQSSKSSLQYVKPVHANVFSCSYGIQNS